MKQDSLVKSSIMLQKVLKARIKQLKLRQTDIIRDAKELGRPSISKANLSLFLSPNTLRIGLKEEDIIWLCVRYAVKITLNITLEDYNQEKCIKNVKIIFNNDLAGYSK